ncbi:hypothetical protein GCM10010441_29790 [Kitasatospora paracochleata]|uniref:Uncharacterized protein n=1 Tax=Kitasatospora paracochleata TaxID=58354 RepID=A0ABT1J922_9ACTN|nr:hypothetical protein [Kitasatospora paracochleata]MCP2313937.1 hypothetical protein [Kitasatospora paracochleata]
MDLLPTLLPGDTSCLAAVAVTTYLPVGAFYIALTGVGGNRLRRPPGPTAVLAAVAASVALTLFWPLLLATRAIRALHRRRTAAAGPLRLATPIPRPAASAPLPPKPSEPPVPPRWYRQEYAAVNAALAEGRISIARTWAGFLTDDAAHEFGPAHPFTREAWLLVARTVHAALTDIRAGQPTDAQPIEDPYGYFLFPQAHRGAWDPDRDSVYTATRGQQAVTW